VYVPEAVQSIAVADAVAAAAAAAVAIYWRLAWRQQQLQSCIGGTQLLVLQ